ncbi:MAG: hypothetical protein WA021_00705 [Minisyncoccia bacterium]
MPLVNIYFAKNIEQKMLDISQALKEFIANELTGADIKLTPEEISIRLLSNVGTNMIASVELEITAHAFSERINKQDEICIRVMNYIKEKTGIDNKVWLKLSELGHSW